MRNRTIQFNSIQMSDGNDDNDDEFGNAKNVFSINYFSLKQEQRTKKRNLLDECDLMVEAEMNIITSKGIRG